MVNYLAITKYREKKRYGLNYKKFDLELEETAKHFKVSKLEIRKAMGWKLE